MRLMSFSATWPQILDGSKTVTRRLGWAHLKPGERFQAIQKGQGLKKGERVVRGPVLECVSNDPENLFQVGYLHDDHETAREGFPEMTPRQFVEMFKELNKCKSSQSVNRIEFKYVEEQK